MFKDWNTYTPKPSTTLLPKPAGVLSGRLTVFDLVRCIAMVMMIQGHVISELTKPALISSNVFPWDIWEFLRGLTAPLFLTVSGAVQVFANKRYENGKLMPTIAKKRIKMAFILIGISYLLVFPADRLYHLPFIDKNVWTFFFQVNILQLIGVSLLMILALFYFTRSNKTFGIISLIIAVVNFALTPLFLSSNMSGILPEAIAPYLSQQNGSIFTIFPFTGFMFFGAAFGALLKSISPEKRQNFIFKFSLIASLILISISYPIYQFVGSFHLTFVENLKGNIGFSILRLGCVFFTLALSVKLYETGKKYSHYYSMFGKRALFIYVLHLLLLYGTPWSGSIGQIYHQSLPLYLSITLAVFIIILSFAITWLYEYSTKRYPAAKLFFRYSLVSTLAFLLLV